MGWCPRSAFSNAKTPGLIRQSNSGHLGVGGEINNCKAIETGELQKDATRRTIRICLERHRPDGAVELYVPNRLVGLEIDDGRRFVLDRTAHSKLSVGGDINVVNAAVHRDALHSRQGGGIDHVDGAGLSPDAHQHALSVAGNCQIIRPVGEGYFLEDLAAFAIHYVEDALGLVTDVDSRAVGRERDAVREFDASDDLYNLVRSGIDGIDRIASAVRHVDANLWIGRVIGRSMPRTTHPVRQGLPVSVVLRRELPATRMKSVASSFRSERVYQKRAGGWLPRNRLLRRALKILARLFRRPFRASRGQGLQMKGPIGEYMAAIAAGMSRPHLQEDGLDFALKILALYRGVFGNDVPCRIR